MSPLSASDQHSPHSSHEEIRAQRGKEFYPSSSANTTSSALASFSCLPCPELSGGILASTTKRLEWCPLHLYQRLNEPSGKFSKTILSFPLASGKSPWSQAGRTHCSRDLCMFPAKTVSTLGKRVHCAQPRESNRGWGTRWPFPGCSGVASIRMVCFGRKGYLSPFCRLYPPPTNTTVSMWAFTSLMKDALEANSFALATAASASFDGAALQGMESDSGHSQHKCVTSCIRSMCNISY